MTSYTYIEQFFKAVLLQSLQIQGRLFILPKVGQELNSDEFHQVMNLATGERKYPAAFMMPPRSEGIFYQNDEWERYRFVLFFLNTTYYDGNNQIRDLNEATQTSMHTVVQDWEEMKRAAIDFIRVLRVVQKGGNDQSINMLNSIFRLGNEKVLIDPVSFVSSTRLSGVRVTFEASVFIGCEIEDYVSGGVVVLPPQEESTFDAELIVVRNEVLNIIESLGLGDNDTIDGGFIF